MQDIQALRAQYRAQQAVLMQAIAAPATTAGAVRKFLQKRSHLVDDALIKLWVRAGLGEPLALLAVGGFGRGELFPHSDVDVLVLLPNGCAVDTDTELKKRIEVFITSCWDAGLEIGSSVRTLDECVAEAAKDVSVQTALLEHRLVCGSTALLQRFQTAFFAALDPRAFFVAKTLEMRQRHMRFEDAPYALEPNCKESPGGLRDLQEILWGTKAADFGRD